MVEEEQAGWKMTMPAPILDRLLAKVVQKDFGCWIWTASTSEGYGRIWTGRPNGRNIMAHRVAYEAFMGPIPKGLTIDHLCRVRRCVNPGHLEPVTMRENTLRGNAMSARCAMKKRCLNGHKLEGDNLFKRYGRICRKCSRLRYLRDRDKKRRLQGYE